MRARFKFEKLAVWQKAINYADATEGFPIHEMYGLCRQLRRAAVSVSSNIAEGNGRFSKADYARFVEIAYSSMMETVSQLHIALRRDYITQQTFEALCADAEELARMLSGLHTSLTVPRTP